MKFKLLILVLFFFFLIKLSYSNELSIESSNIKIFENGNLIKAEDVEVDIPDKKLLIKSENSTLNKKQKFLTFSDNVKLYDSLNNIYVESKKLSYDENKNIIKSYGETLIQIGQKYKINSSDLIYERNKLKIYSKKETTISDNQNNIYNFDKRILIDLKNEIVTAENATMMDYENNSYKFQNVKINLKNKNIAGKELEIDFVDNYFGNSKNDPVLKGRSAISNDAETKIYKSSFTTCNTENKTCPGWEIQAEEFTHDKISKTFNYKNSWLKLFDKEIFYFPYFSHPDPTIKRKSGFLVPYYGSSNNFGSWVNIPYFKTIGLEKDLTLNPRIYADDKLILQSEYRQAFERSNLISDMSYNNDGKNSNAHFFAKINSELDYKSKLNINLQDVSNDNYLKLHNLSNSSSLIKDESLLTSSINYSNKIDEKTTFQTDFIIYEDLTKRDSDKFQYILPSFSFRRNIELEKNSNGNFIFTSNGFQKNYDTNIYETLLINDFQFNSNNKIYENGLTSNYNFLIKNFNSYTENSNKYKNKEDYEVFGAMLFKTSYPMKNKSEKFNNFFKPIVSVRYSPNNTKNISNNDASLNYYNIFSLNRIGTNEIVEGGKSVSYGFEYEKYNFQDEKLFGLNIANSVSEKKNNNLPKKTNLNETRSDIVGNLVFIPSKNLEFNYTFSQDRDLKGSSYDSIKSKINFGMFSTNFDFISETNEIANKEILLNTSYLNLDDENSVKLNFAKDLKIDFTEYYNLIYEYKTDCLRASIEYNKKFYRDGNLKPDKSLLFYIKFIPFAEIASKAPNK